MMKFYHTFIFLMTLFTSCSANDRKNIVLCDSHQYLEMATPGTIYCSITKPFHGVYWYDSSDSRTNHPVLSFEDNVKGGTAYQSGMFDVDSDGSLIINDVSLVHEHLFKVVVVYSDADSLEAVVRVSVQVKPYRDYPIIDQCGGEHTCLRDLQHAPVLTCRVQDARPRVNLTWITRTIDGNSILHSESYYTFDGVTTTTIANITVDAKAVVVLALFICSAEYSYNTLLKAESQITIENRTYNPGDVKPKVLLVEMRTNQTLNCGRDDSQLFVWKRVTSTNLFETILFSTMENSTILMEGYNSVAKGVLALEKVGARHEGIYLCTFGNGISGGNQLYNLSVFAYPKQRALVIDNCDPLNERRCYIESGRQGNLTCRVREIRPDVELKWILTSTSSSSVISLEPQTPIVHNNGDTFDVFLETTYRIPKPVTRASFTCKVAGSHSLFNFSEQVTVLVEDDDEVQVFPPHAAVIVAVLIPFIILVVAATLTLCYRQRRVKHSEQPERNPQHEDEPENVPMITQVPEKREETEQPRTSEFQEVLKEAYKTLCDGWLLLPSSTNRKLSMSNVFVENTLHRNGSSLQALYSYHDMFGNDCQKRVLLIGDPGMGKTSIALKAAYDWCEKNPNSPLKDTDIFILIRLRCINREASLVQAIKTSLLPNDSELEEDDIKLILSSCTSLVIILDGFDEYAGDNESTSSDIFKIIKGSLYPGAKVITTTIPSVLPERTESETTKIIISGFNELARSEYVRKVCDEGGQILRDNVEKTLKENLYLKHLCNVPLVLALLTHIRGSPAATNRITSVTHLFNTCLGENAETKVVLNSDSFSIFYSDVYEKAYESLVSKNNQLDLLSDDYVRNMAEEFYQKFVSVGVLVEVSNLSQSAFAIGATRTTPGKLSYSHQLYQAWFAAHHLVKLLKETPEGAENQSLKGINPRRQPYLLRFASGFSKTAANKIIQHIIQEGCRDLAILCVFEKDRNCTYMENTIKQLCGQPFQFQRENAEVLDQSMIDLLKAASKKKIPISSVEFCTCLATFHRISDAALQTLQCLKIHEPYRELTKHEVSVILSRSAGFQNLKILSFTSKGTPKNTDKEDITSKLLDRGLKDNKIWFYTCKVSLQTYQATVSVMSTFSPNKLRKTFPGKQLKTATASKKAPEPPPETPMTPSEGVHEFKWPTADHKVSS